MKHSKFMKRLLLFISICLLTSTTTNAQFLKRLKKKVEDKLEQKIENKIDKETDKVIDSALYGKRKKKEIPTSEVPKFTSETGILKFYNHGYEYVTKDISISVYGKFSTKNLSTSAKTYTADNIIAPVDAFPEGYALATNDDGYLNSKDGQLQVHMADSTKVVYSLKGTWNTIEGNKAVNASFVTLNVADIVDERKKMKERNDSKNDVSKNENNTITNSDKKFINSKISPTVDIPSTFAFHKNIAVEVTNDRGESYPIEFLLGSYPDIYGISVASKEMQGQGKVIMVMTPKSSTAFMDVAGMKMKRTTSLEQMGSQFNMTEKLPENGDFEYKKTGNTKTILGYTCEEYKVDYNYTNESGSASFWVSTDFPIQNKALPMLGMSMNNPNFSGFVLELNSTHNGQNWTMKVTNLSDINTTINANEFRKMGY